MLKRTLAIAAICTIAGTANAIAVSAQTQTSPKTFRDWCLEKSTQSPELQKTIDTLLRRANTQDCTQAERTLTARIALDLTNDFLTDLRPLASLTQLTSLNLTGNLTTDLKPLASLTRLTSLDLSGNYYRDVDAGTFQLTDFSPLASLQQAISDPCHG